MTLERGGEMKIGTVTVRAGVVPNVLPGRTYLAFLNPERRSQSNLVFPQSSRQWRLVPVGSDYSR